MVAIAGDWVDPADNADDIAWIRETWREIDQFGTGSMYLNFNGLADEQVDAVVTDAFGPNLPCRNEVDL